jgi:ribosomal protein S21
MSKQEMRKQLAALSFSEKVKILEKLRDRSLSLAASGLRQRPAADAVKRQTKQTS